MHWNYMMLEVKLKKKNQYAVIQESIQLNSNLSSYDTQIRMKLGTFSTTCAMYGISDRSAAALAPSVFQDSARAANDIGKHNLLVPVIDRDK